MKKKILFSILTTVVVGLAIYIFKIQPEENAENSREKHKLFMQNSPFKDTKNLSRKERKALSLPPNAYYEREYELTMNPKTGFPTPYVLNPIDISPFLGKGLPGNGSSLWTERGPFNTGGRTRVVFYDPNDVGANNGDGINYNKVFAGGVGGGLWVNNDITNANSPWTIIPGIIAGANVNCYAIDPNNTQIMYIGTGEQYTSGASVGNGIYKTTDGGATWTSLNVQPAGIGTTTIVNDIFKAGIFFVNDLIVRNVNGSSELYAGIGSTIYDSPNFNISNPNSILGAQNAGLYRSADNGATWSRIENTSMAYTFAGEQFFIAPNDFEIGADNTLYFGSISSRATNMGGGRIFSSVDGLNWTLARQITNSNRVELATSKTNANLIYVATQASGNQADLYITNDKFTSILPLNEPDDADNSIPASDFTRGQAFYDLVIEVSPVNDQQVYVGGINLHRSGSGGLSWDHVSKWSNNPNLNTKNVPFIHADIHGFTFHPVNRDQAVIGSDGGVSYATSLADATFITSAIETRNLGYNVTQFYYGSIYINGAANGDDLIGGSQDNGTLGKVNALAGNNIFNEVLGGDGAYTQIDKDGVYAIVSTQYENHRYINFPSLNGGYCITNNCNDGSKGDFINVAELDDNLDVLYSNSRTFSNNNGISVCQLLPSTAACTTITNGLISGNRPTALKVSPFTTNSTKLYIGTEFGNLIRVDGANDFTPTWNGIGSSQFVGSISDIEFGSSEQEIFVTMHNYGVQSIWYTSDGGTTWAGKEGNLPDMPVKSILKNPLLGEEVIIGTELGVWATGDFNSPNPTWFPIINGMTNVKVLDLDLRASDNTILATTHGRGMFTGTFTTAGFADVLNNRNIVSIYPTVNNGAFNINALVVSNEMNVSIYNLSGQQVYADRLRLTGSEQRITAGNLKDGIYLVKTVVNGLSQTTKIVIKN